MDVMLREMTAAQLMDWFAYYAVEPWGEERADLRIGILSAMVANAFGAKAKPEDFLLADRMPKPKQDVKADMERMAATLLAMKTAGKRAR